LIPGLELVETLITNAAVEDRLSRLQEVRRQLEGNLWNASEAQARAYNKRHRPVEFWVNQKVLLLTKNICSWRPSKKLDAWYAGPFAISKVIGSQAY
jgi:hypothetical protein